MKEDVLEQVVEDYLQHLGFFTVHNVKFKPSPAHPDYVKNQDAVASYIDIVGIIPHRYGPDRVWVVSCKAYQAGFSPEAKLKEFHNGTVKGTGPVWKRHRELWQPKWGQALLDRMETLTGQRCFRYFTAVTVLKPGNWRCWQQDEHIRGCLEGNWVGFLRLEDMWRNLVAQSTTTVAASEIGRLAQMLIAAHVVRPNADVVDDPSLADQELVAPHLADRFWAYPSVAGMYCPPPAVADVADVFRYADTLDGYAFATQRYPGGDLDQNAAITVASGRLPGPWEALPAVMPRALPNAGLSFERLRLLAFHQYRAWHHYGYGPDEVHAPALVGLHQAVQAAWAQQRFDFPRP
jgi:hypothetical protein